MNETAAWFSVALTREPTGRFLSGYHEHFVHGCSDIKCARRKLAALDRTAMVRQGFGKPNDTEQLSIIGRLQALEAFVDYQLAWTPATAALQVRRHAHFERDFHLAPQVAFLISRNGTPLKLDYIAGSVEEEARFRMELSYLGFFSASTEYAKLPHVSGKNSSFRLPFRRVSTDELSHPSNHTARLAVRLQRKICRLMLADYCCLGYSFPSACAEFVALC